MAVAECSVSSAELEDSSRAWLPLVGVVGLWVPAMIAASYVWANGDYYDYGWFVPPAALVLLVRRWKAMAGEVRPLPAIQVGVGCAVLLPWFILLRVLGYADPSWRLPMGVLGMTAALGMHWVLGWTRGWKASAEFIWITLLLFSALPWPVPVERQIVSHLTSGVIQVVAEVYQLLGKPVEAVGDRLRLNEITVEVTDGCSGVRSFQSFLMATWFFTELQRLRVEKATILLGVACVVAFLVNTLRTFSLAEIRFVSGEEAFHRAHDSLGLLAFAVSGVLFFFISGWLSNEPRRKLVKTVHRASH